MSDELEVASTTENADQPAPETGAQVAEESKTEASAPDDKLAGKTESDLKEIIRNQEKLLGKQANEVGDVRAMRQELDYLKEMIRQASVQPERQQAAPVEPEPQYDPITNPDAWFKSKWDKEMGRVRQLQQQQEQARLQQEVASRFSRGKADFLSDRSQAHLYEGIEADLERAMIGFIRNGTVKVHDLDDKRTWATAASVLRLSRGEADRLVRKPGMSAPDVEKPAPRRQADDTISITDEDRMAVRELGLGGMTDKEILEALKAGVQGIKTGLTKRGA
jgi:hypothetical protein